jgi:transcription antitermination factor NusG
VYKKGRRAEVPVFPGYVFCRLDIWNPLAVMTTPGVFSIVSHGATPSPIPDWEIENVRRMIDSNLNVRPWPEVKPGSDFTIPSGPLRGVQGIVENTGDERWLIVSVQLLRKGIGVKLDPACVYGL